MNETEIRRCFGSHWVFSLYEQRRIPYLALIFLIPALLWIVGLVGAAILGEFTTFSKNVLAYLGPAAIGLSLAAYYWFAKNVPKQIEIVSSAFDIPSEEVCQKLTALTNRYVNPVAYILIAGAAIAALTLSDLVTLWRSPEISWEGQAWVKSDHDWFFAAYFGFYDVLAMGFLLGSGVSGMFGSLLVIHSLLKIPIKLDCYRRMRAIYDLSLGLAFWGFVAFSIVLVTRVYIKPLDETGVALSSAALSLTASVVLLGGLLFPIWSAHQSILAAKMKRIASYEEWLHNISRDIDQLMLANQQQLDDLDEGNLQTEPFEKRQAVLDRLRQQRDEIQQSIAGVEKIPAWPMSWLGFFQIVSTSLMPAVIGIIPGWLTDKVLK